METEEGTTDTWHDKKRLQVAAVAKAFRKLQLDDKTLLRMTFMSWKTYTRHKVLQRKEREYALKLKVLERKHSIRDNALSHLASILVIGMFVMILYYNYVMISAYITPLILAFLVGIPLSVMKTFIMRTLDHMDVVLVDKNKSTLAIVYWIFLGVQVFSVTIMYWIPTLMTLQIALLIPANFLLIAFFFQSKRESLVSTMLMVTLICVFVFPLFFWIKNCVAESAEATSKIVSYLQNNAELQQLLNDYENSTIYHRLASYAESWGWDPKQLDLDILKEKAIQLISSVGNHVNLFFETSMSLVSNLGSMVGSTIVFLSTLYYLVEQSPKIWQEMGELSPVPAKDQYKISKSLKESASRIFLCSIAVGSLHFTVTYVSFYLCDLEMKHVLAAVSGFLAIVPLFGNWLIWLPATLVLFFQEQYLRAAFVGACHMVAAYGIQPIIYSYIPGNPYYTGLSAALGISSFGVAGAIYGPLLAGFCLTLLDILKTYYAEDCDTQETVTREKKLQ